jgi:hypothetical protein
LFDQITEGQLQWKDVADDYDTVVLVDDKKQDKDSLNVVNEHFKNGTTLPSVQVSMRSGKEPTIQSLLRAFPEEEAAIFIPLCFSSAISTFFMASLASKSSFSLDADDFVSFGPQDWADGTPWRVFKGSITFPPTRGSNIDSTLGKYWKRLTREAAIKGSSPGLKTLLSINFLESFQCCK